VILTILYPECNFLQPVAFFIYGSGTGEKNSI
jgi:hypothetical protein